MRNGVSFYKQYCWRPGVSSGGIGRAGLALAGLVLWAALPAVPSARTAESSREQAAAFGAPGTASPGLARLFTPRHAPAGAFEVTVLDGNIERARAVVLAAAREGTSPAAGNPPPVLELDPLQAFGEAGSYQHTTVARLYTGRKARVVRIPVERNGRTVAAVTLISPYPDPTLSRLEEGTMLILLHLDRIKKEAVGGRPGITRDNLSALHTAYGILPTVTVSN
jgi:hypothetical protein